MKYCFGVDIGGTTVKLGLFTTEGEIVDKWEIKTRTENQGEAVLPDIAAALNEKLEEKQIPKDEVEGIGVGVPAPVDSEGVVQNTAHLGWGYKEVKREMEELSGMKAEIGNDANVAALGEMWLGAGKGRKNIIMVTLGTGVGGGIVMNGKIVTGSHGAAGEIGHLTVNLHETRVCGCGKRGCLEQYSSAPAIMRSARDNVANTDTPSLLRDYSVITGKEIFDAYKAGDDMAEDVVNEFAEYLGLGLAHTAQVIDPEAFVIGGGVSKNGQVVADITKEKYEKNVMFALKDKEFRLAELGNDAGMYGAVRMVLVD